MKQILDMVMHAPLCEADGDSFMSRDAYGHPCTAGGALWRPSGRGFSGVNGRINCGSAPVLDGLGTIGNCQFSVGAWIKPNSKGQTYGRIADKNTIRFYCADTQTIVLDAVFSTVSKKATAPNNSVPYGAWSFVVGIYNGAYMLICVNGVLTFGDAVTGPVDAHSSSDCFIGNRVENDRCFDGLIGEVMVYNRALTPQEIKRIYLETKWRYQ